MLAASIVSPHDLSVALSCLLILLTSNDSLQQIFSVLILEAIHFVLVAEGVAQVERVLEHLVVCTLQVNLILNDLLEESKLVIKAQELGRVSILEVVGLQVKTRPTRHQVSEHLHQALLLKRINDVFVAL